MLSVSTIFFTSFVVALTGALMPGPVLAVTIERSARHGWLAGTAVASGHALLELLVVAAILLGLKPYLTAPWFLGPLGVLGGAVLVWMGVQTVRTAASARTGVQERPDDARRLRLSPRELGKSAVCGVTTSASNPYFLIWWGTFGAGAMAVALSRGGFAGISAFYVGHILADITWFTLIGVLIASGGRWMSDTIYRWMLRILGGFLVAFALYFVKNGAAALVEALE